MTHHVDLSTIRLERGSHPNVKSGVCLLEATAYFAGKEHTDAPPCVSPVLRNFGIAWNDALDDETRQRLIPYIPRLIGTAGNKKADNLRAWMATDWLVRTYAPAWLRKAGLVSHADALAALPALTSAALARKAQATIEVAGSAAGSAAYSAAYSALADTVKELQESALALFDRMIDAGEPVR